MKTLRKHISVAIVGIGSIICIGAVFVDSSETAKYPIAIGAALVTTGLLKFLVNVNKSIARFTNSFKKFEQFKIHEKNLQGRSRFEVSSILKKVSGDYDLVREHQKSSAMTRSIDFRTRALFAAMKKNELRAEEENNLEFGSIVRGIDKLDKITSQMDSRTRKIFAQTSDVHSIYSEKSEIPMFTELSEQMMVSNRKVITSFGTAFYGISNRLYEVEHSLAELLEIGKISSISQWQINHRTLLGGLELMRTAASIQDYLRSSKAILGAAKRVSVSSESNYLCGGLSEFSLYYATGMARNESTGIILCRNVLEQEFVLGIIENLAMSEQIVPVLREEIRDLLGTDSESTLLIEKSEYLEPDEIIAVSSSLVEALRG
ncbi:hypothetical protein D3C74_35160 [compost metagenome]